MTPQDTYRGLTICDLGQGVAAPHATMLFALHGADVVKVEPPDGDWGRALGRTYGEHSVNSFVFNRGKRSVLLDLKSPRGRAAIVRLIARSDVFVESFRPGTAARLGLSYEAVSEINPSIIYASLSGFGQTGPYSRRGTVDALIQGFSGMMAMNGAPGGPPIRQNMPAVDILSGLYLFAAIAMAVERRNRSGAGSRLDVSLMQSAAAFQAAKIAEAHLGPGAPEPLYMPSGCLPASDGNIVVSTMRQAQYEALCEGLGRADLARDPRFADARSRIENGVALMRELGRTTRELNVRTLLDRLQARDVLVEPVLSYEQWLRDPHVAESGAVEWMTAPGVGVVPIARFPGEAGDGQVPRYCRAPSIGEHTDAVLGELGLRG